MTDTGNLIIFFFTDLLGLMKFVYVRTITSPIDGRLNFKQAYVIILFTWFWSMPFVILPYLQIWGKFTTGKYEVSAKI